IPRKTKSEWVWVLRPSRRNTSAKLRSPLQIVERNGAAGKKWASATKPVQKTAIATKIIKRCRPSQCTAELYQLRSTNVEFRSNDQSRMTKRLLKPAFD